MMSSDSKSQGGQAQLRWDIHKGAHGKEAKD